MSLDNLLSHSLGPAALHTRNLGQLSGQPQGGALAAVKQEETQPVEVPSTKAIFTSGRVVPHCLREPFGFRQSQPWIWSAVTDGFVTERLSGVFL
jgi:hypothetical protein